MKPNCHIRRAVALLLTVALLALPLVACKSSSIDGSSTDQPSQGSGTESHGSTASVETETEPDWDALYPADAEYVLTSDGLFEVGSVRNIVVILVDRFDTRYVDLITKSQPDYFDRFEDFTYYNNNVSTYSRTYPAMATMLTGVLRDFTPDSSAVDYFEAAYQQSPLLLGLKDAGYAVHLHMQDYYTYRNARVFRGLADNLGRENESTLFEMTDPAIFALLKENGLTVGEHGKLFSFLHIEGTHYPYQMDENGNQAEGKGEALGAALGSMKLVQMYIDELKAKGLYENSTIIITGDHPDPISDYNEPTRARATALFVKRAGVSHEYRTSSAPVSDLDLIPSILADSGLAYEGEAYWEIAEDAVRPRYHYFPLNSDPAGNESLTVYEIVGDAKDFENWKRLRNVPLNGRLYR